MRSSAAQYLHDYDMRPVISDIYVCDVVDRGGKMIKALRDWEKRRGIVHSFKSKFIEPKEKPKLESENTKPRPVSDRKIVVPRTQKQTPEEKRRLKNERNKQYRLKHLEKSRQTARDWRAKRTPEQIENCRQQLRDHRARQRAAKQQRSLQAAQVPLSNATLP